MNKYKKKGFTLVEIMIVVVIIGLLAAMAIPAFNKVRATSQDKAVKNNLRQLAAAAQQYMLDKGVTRVVNTDVVGTSTEKYISQISLVGGETYTITIDVGTTQIATEVAGRIVTYQF